MALPNREKLERLIATAQIREAIEELLHPEADIETDLRLQVVALSGRLKNLLDKELGGLMSTEDIELERNKISKGLLDLIVEIPKTREEEIELRRRNAKKKLVQTLSVVLYLGLVAGALWWLFQPKRQLQITADLLVERVSFRYKEGPATFARGLIQQCSWQNCRMLQLEAAQILIDEDLDSDWEQTLHSTAPLQIYPNADIPGLSLQFGPARMERFSLQPGSFLTLSRPEEDPRLFRIAVQQEQELTGEWTFADSLTITTEHITIKGLGQDLEYESPVLILAVPPPALARELQLTGFPGTTTIDFLLLDSLSMESKELMIEEISFYQPVENVAIPTTLGGTVKIAETDKPVLRELKIQEGDALDFTLKEALRLNRLIIEPQGIYLSLAGKVQQIETGKLRDLRNPLRIEWLWHNKRLNVLVFCVGFLLFSWFFLRRLFTWPLSHPD